MSPNDISKLLIYADGRKRTLGDITDLIERHVLLVPREVDQVHRVLQVEVGFAVVVEAYLDVLDDTCDACQRAVSYKLN